MKLKNKLFGLLSVGAAASIGSVSVTMLTDSLKQTKLDNEKDKSTNDNTSKDNVTENVINSSLSKTSSDIVNGAPAITNDLLVIKANNLNKVQNKNEFLNKTFSIRTYEQFVNKKNLRKDLMFYLNSLWKSNGKQFAMTFVTEPTISVASDYTRNVNLNVQIKLTNLLPSTSSFNFDNYSLEIAPNSFAYFELRVDNSPFKLTINSFNNRFFLGVKFDSIIVNCYDKQSRKIKSYKLKDFTFTPKNFSYIFLSEFSGLTNQLNYRQLYDDDNFDFYRSKLTNKEIANNISLYAYEQQNLIMASLRAADKVFESISRNPKLDIFLNDTGSSISYLLTQLKIIPAELQGLVTDLISNDKTVIQVIQDNRNTIEKFALSILGNDPFFSGLITSVLDKIKPNMTPEEREEFFSLLEVIPGDLSFIKSILGKIFDSGKTFDIIVDLLLNSSDEIKDLIKGVPFVSEILDFLKNTFIKFNGNPEVLSVFAQDKESIIKLLKTFLSSSGMALPQTFWFYFDQLFTNNSNFNVDKLKYLFQTTFVGFTRYFLTSITTSGNFVKNVEYNYEKNTVSFKYKFVWTLTKDYVWSILPLKNILPSYIGIQGFPFKIPTKWVTDVLFDYIRFTKNDRVVFTYEAINQPLWAKPKLVDGMYYFGYTIPHKLKVWLDWPGGYNSIAGQFHWFIGQWNAASDITYYALSQQHEVLQTMSFYDKNKVLGDSQYYGDDVYMDKLQFKWNPITNDLKWATRSSLARETLRRYDVYTADLTNRHQYIWSTSLKIAENKLDDLVNKYVWVNDNVKNDPRLQPIVYLHPIVDLRLRYLSTQILSVFVFEAVVMFPYDVMNVDTGATGNVFKIYFTL